MCVWNGEKCVRRIIDKYVKNDSKSRSVSPVAQKSSSPKSKSPVPKSAHKSRSKSPKPRSKSPVSESARKSPISKSKSTNVKDKSESVVKKSRSKSPVSKSSVQKSKSKSPVPKSKSPDSAKNKMVTGVGIESLGRRHCHFYSDDPKYPLPTLVDTETDPKYKMKYDTKWKSHNTHIGQRKLLLSEIQFLTTYYKAHRGHPTLLYVGAAPGSHMTFLSFLFPAVKFVLYDGAKFDPRLKTHPAFEIHEGTDGFMTTEKCKELVAKKYPNLLFVSDIRLDGADHDAFEHGVTRDMSLQKEWVEILKPVMSLLKFRMSYHMKEHEKMTYLKGILYYGIWPRPVSGETRLLVKKADIGKDVAYDFTDYEETMFYHNKVRRSFCYPIEDRYKKYMTGAKNTYCSCYDCMMELTTLNKYAIMSRRPIDEVVNNFWQHMKLRPIFQVTKPADTSTNKAGKSGKVSEKRPLKLINNES